MAFRPIPRVSPRALAVLLAGAGLAAAAVGLARPNGQEGDRRRDVSVSAHKYAFEPSEIEVEQNDLVRITFRAEDIPHSFAVDAYRIAKRANPGDTVIFEFRADQAGTFPFYCNLRIDDGCRNMRGQLVVRSR